MFDEFGFSLEHIATRNGEPESYHDSQWEGKKGGMIIGHYIFNDEEQRKAFAEMMATTTLINAETVGCDSIYRTLRIGAEKPPAN